MRVRMTSRLLMRVNGKIEVEQLYGAGFPNICCLDVSCEGSN